MKEFELKSEYFELGKFLKYMGLASSGSEAKEAISQGLVKVNSSVETKIRKKLIAGDEVEFGNEKFVIKTAKPE